MNQKFDDAKKKTSDIENAQQDDAMNTDMRDTRSEQSTKGDEQ